MMPVEGSQPPVRVSRGEYYYLRIAVSGRGAKYMRSYEELTLTGALNSIAYPDRLAVAVLLTVALPDAFVGVVLEVGHFYGIWV